MEEVDLDKTCAVVAISSRARHCTSHQTAVIAPVEAEPRACFPRLILKVSRRVELLVVVNPEDLSALPDRHAQPAELREIGQPRLTRLSDICEIWPIRSVMLTFGKVAGVAKLRPVTLP